MSTRFGSTALRFLSLLVLVSWLVLGASAAGAFSGGGSLAAYTQSVFSFAPPDAYYHLDESSGTDVVDSSGNNHDASYIGNVALGQPGVLVNDAAVGVSGNTGYVQGPTLAPLSGASDRTVELWFATSSAGNLFHAGAFAHAQAFDLAVTGPAGPGGCGNPGGIGFYLRMWDNDIFIPDGDLTDGTWHYAAVTVEDSGQYVSINLDGDRMRGYVWNGSCYTANPVPQSFRMPFTVNTAPGPFTLGNFGWTSGITGRIDEAAIYDQALPNYVLADHFAAGNPPPPAVYPTVLMSLHGQPTSPSIIGTFYDASGSPYATDFGGFVNWGDSVETALNSANFTLDPNLADCSYLGHAPTTGTCFQISATHIYRLETHGPYQYGITIYRGGQQTTAYGLAEVSAFSAVPNQPANPSNVSGKTVGIVSVLHKDGTAFQCTATVVDSPHGNVIVSARHCGFRGDPSNPVTKIEFAPGADGGSGGKTCGGSMVDSCGTNPYGYWTTTDITGSVNQIDPDPNVDHDFTFITFPPQARGPSAGLNLEQAVGAVPLNFFYSGAPQHQNWSLFGYGTGYSQTLSGNTKLLKCINSQNFALPTNPYNGVDPEHHLAAYQGGCYFPTGTSGSPWFSNTAVMPYGISAIDYGHFILGDGTSVFEGTVFDQIAAQLFLNAALAP